MVNDRNGESDRRRVPDHCPDGPVQPALQLLLPGGQAAATDVLGHAPDGTGSGAPIAAPSPQVIFSGGEPLLEFPAIQAAVRYLEEKSPPGRRIRLGLSTNGILLNDNIADFLAQHDFETHLSFDGVPLAQDLRARSTFAVLDRLLDKIGTRNAEYFAHKLRVNMTLMPAAIVSLSESISYFLGKGVRELVVYPADLPDSAWSGKRTEELQDQFAAVFETCLRHFQQTGQVPLLLFRRKPEEFLRRTGGRLMCGALSGRNITVDVDGLAYGCPLAVESYRRVRSPVLRSRLARLKIGAVSDPQFGRTCIRFEALSRASEPLYRKETKHSCFGRCSECRFFDLCETCPLSAGCNPRNSDPDRVPDFPCAFHRIALAFRDGFPVGLGTLDMLQAAMDRKAFKPERERDN